MRCIAPLCLLLLAGCADPELARLAGPNPPAISPRRVALSIAEPGTVAAVGHAFAAVGERGVLAFSNPDATPCEVTIPVIEGPYDQRAFVLLYHELRHCQEGRWHP